MFRLCALLYLDVLGTKGTMSRPDSERAAALMQMLKSLTRQQGNYAITEHRDVPVGQKVHAIRPAISTFSDNIAISVPLDVVDGEPPNIGPVGHFQFALLGSFAAKVFADALSIGLLVRGSITVGLLDHVDAIGGPALQEGYELEQTLAGTPRIVFSESAREYARFVHTFTDADGCLCLDVFRLLMVPDTQGHNDDLISWRKTTQKIIDHELAALNQPEHARHRAKWEWFSAMLNKTGAK